MKRTKRRKRPDRVRAGAQPQVNPAAIVGPDTGRPFPVVGVGASAGGLEAFTRLLRTLAPDTGMGFVLIQHLDPEHESALVQLLSRVTSLPVRAIADNQPVLPNHVHVIPRDTHLTIAQGILKLRPRERTRKPHRPIDAFFESLAADRRDLAIGVVLSGTANDGTLGLEAIKAEGGITFAQDDSAGHDSMPRSAEAAGCVDMVLAPEEIAGELARMAKHPYLAEQRLGPLNGGSDDTSAERGSSGEEARASATEHEDDPSPLPSGGRGAPRSGARQAREEADRGRDKKGVASKGAKAAPADDYQKILLLLRSHSGVDFSLYRSNTIQRRIHRRLVLSKQDTLAGYADFLRGNAKELDSLYSDVLISVTSFFRNPESFELLQRRVLPKLLGRPGDEPVRVWTLGCSTGQEAYSLAMAFVEVMEKAPRMRKLQVFATDLNDALLDKARHALYARSLAEDISPERLRRFFVEEEGGYRVNKMLREMVVFARQNLVNDPPFSRMDLISCRNLLIYLEPNLQKKVLPTFHYALKPEGYLFLGASESIGGFTDLFDPVDKKHKIFVKKPAPTPALHLPLRKAHGEPPPGLRPILPVGGAQIPKPPEGFRDELGAQREADRVTISQFAPPGVLVDADLQILQFRGPTGAYLEPPSGKASFALLKMARPGLMLPLRAAIDQAAKEDKAVRRDDVRIKRNGATHHMSVEVVPLKTSRERCFLILFHEAGDSRRAAAGAAPRQKRHPRKGRAEEPGRAGEVETELADTRLYLQAMQEQHEAATEELQAANEEVQSANEELQSINEELETSKEELESTNEELTTLNEEMTNRNLELHRVNNDLLNLQASAKLCIVLLGRDLTVRRFSKEAVKQFDLMATDAGRPVGHIRSGLVYAARPPNPTTDEQAARPLAEESSVDLERLAGEVIAAVREQEHEVFDRRGRWHSLHVRPYMTLDNKVDGAVLLLMDIDTLKRSEQAAAQLAAIITSSDDAIMGTDLHGVLTSWNPAAQRLFGYAAAEVIGKPMTLLIPPHHADREVGTVERVLRGEIVEHYETERQRKDGSLLDVSLTVSPVRDADGRIIGASKIARDVSEHRRAVEALRRSEAQFAADAAALTKLNKALAATDRHRDEFLAMLAHELRNPLAPLRNANALEIIRLSDDRQAREQAQDMMRRQVGLMVRLVDDLLDASRITRGKLPLRKERVGLAMVVGSAVETVRPLVEAAGQDLEVTLPPEPIYLHGDPTRLSQVLSNLLGNSVKYNHRHGHIWLRAETRDGEVVISVKDDGIGIPAEQLPQVFEMFSQGDRSIERTHGGLGIGLAVVKGVVEMHGGSVEARSDGAGRGSEFVVRLPVVAEGPMLEQPAEDDGKNVALPRRRVLVADDNPDGLGSLEALIQLLGSDVRTAHDGLEAVQVATEFRPDLILMDVGMPALNGLDATRRIREQPWGKAIRIFALTGWAQEADRRHSTEAGCDGHLAKPVDVAALKKLLSELPAPGHDGRPE